MMSNPEWDIEKLAEKIASIFSPNQSKDDAEFDDAIDFLASNLFPADNVNFHKLYSGTLDCLLLYSKILRISEIKQNDLLQAENETETLVAELSDELGFLKRKTLHCSGLIVNACYDGKEKSAKRQYLRSPYRQDIRNGQKKLIDKTIAENTYFEVVYTFLSEVVYFWRLAKNENEDAIDSARIHGQAGEYEIDSALRRFHFALALLPRADSLLEKCDVEFRKTREFLVEKERADQASQKETTPLRPRKRRKITINELMRTKLEEDTLKATWKSKEWARFLDCGESTIRETDVWKSLMTLEPEKKAELASQKRNEKGKQQKIKSKPKTER